MQYALQHLQIEYPSLFVWQFFVSASLGIAEFLSSKDHSNKTYKRHLLTGAKVAHMLRHLVKCTCEMCCFFGRVWWHRMQSGKGFKKNTAHNSMLFLLDHLWCVFIFLFLIAQKKRGMPPRDHQNFQRLLENILWELKFSMPNTLHQKKRCSSARHIFGIVERAVVPLFWKSCYWQDIIFFS